MAFDFGALRCASPLDMERRNLPWRHAAQRGWSRLASGDGGFGYDPIFFHPPIGKTFAQISREQKQGLSHRGAAIAAMLGALRDGRLVLQA